MKRLLSLMALVLLTCSAVGCECCGLGNMGLLQRFGRRSECNTCNQCNTCGRCNSCSRCETCEPMMAPSGCGCGCGSGEPAMMMRPPSISPEAEALSVSSH
jgi:hypothetical protein